MKALSPARHMHCRDAHQDYVSALMVQAGAGGLDSDGFPHPKEDRHTDASLCSAPQQGKLHPARQVLA